MHGKNRQAVPLILFSLVLLIAALSSCSSTDRAPKADGPGRLEYNRLAVRANLPLYWTADADGDGVADPDEIAALEFYPTRGTWVEDGEFTPEYRSALETLKRMAGRDLPPGLSADEQVRVGLVHREMDHGIPTLVYNDLQGMPEDHRAFLGHMMEVARLIDILYARHVGAEALAERLPADAASRSLFRRNWGPDCVAPRTQDDPACSAIPGGATPVFDLYPASLQADENFCAELESRPDAAELLDPFTVVREIDGDLQAVPYTVAYAEEMGAVATELGSAADALVDPNEDALRSYLAAAAQAFTDNDWQPADEAWSRMSARNSKWYVRVAPDEVYWEPCSQKAGLHLTLALLNTASLSWEDRILPVRQEMEDDLARLIGPPYAAREVTFHLPDFIDIVVNAGDDRDPLGATIGQSLPNWGPVANEGRGRTVAMSNLYTDPDSIRIQREQVASLFTAGTMESFSDSPEPGLLGTILHEATHNFGPAHEYRYKGKTDTVLFGGPLASTMEEYKAQNGALWFIHWLAARGIITEQMARETYVDSLRWALDHISRGMYTGSGRPKAYSQLAAMEIGFLLDHGALAFDPAAMAANGRDTGAFTIDFEKLPLAVESMMRQSGSIKATGDKAAAEQLKAKYVDSEFLPLELISERILRHPKASFVYAVDY